ncbi:hypothetical protein [Pseudogemmobacter sonorensis]|uniref:hypothetical protein n=1 Tax=Pseudogemmobacter sonorensis TaxID=2989681 RepID=UPI0036974046
MPNVKIYVDEAAFEAVRQEIAARLPDLRTMLCDRLAVAPAACQFAVLPVLALADQPRINTELHILPHASRSRARLQEVAAEIRAILGAASGLSVAVRIATLDAASYVALK